MSMPLVPPFAVTASYQTEQYGTGSTQVAQSSVLSHLVTPPTTAASAETASENRAKAAGFSAYAAADAVQVITIGGTPTGGTFVLSFGDKITSALAFDAAAATVETALQALTSIGSGNATVSGDAGGPYTVTFARSLVGTPVATIAADGTLLTGGSHPDVTVSVTTRGRAAFTNQAVLNVKQQFDGIRNDNDLASGMHA